MPYFGVSVEGTGGDLCLEVQRRRWLLPRRLLTRPEGFLTTRWVEAVSPQHALDSALDSVRRELHEEYSSDSETWSLGATDWWEVDERVFAEQAPGSGFTWYGDALSMSSSL